MTTEIKKVIKKTKAKSKTETTTKKVIKKALKKTAEKIKTKTERKAATKKAIKKTAVKPAPKKTRKPNKETQRLLKTIISAIQNIKGEKILSIDVSNIAESVTDYFVIAEATTFIQLKGIADNIEREVKDTCDQKIFRRNVDRESPWFILDYIDIVVHLFLPEHRNFYNLEECWSDGIFEQHQ